MGKVFETKNIRFMIYTKDHNPAHVHAISPNGEAKIEIETLECFYLRGFSQKDLGRIIKFLSENNRQEILMEVWNEYHT